MTNAKRRLFLLTIACLVILIDQLTKTAALNILSDHANKYGFITFGVVYNDGTAFGLGAHFLPFLLAAGAIAFGVVVYTMRSLNTKGVLMALALVGGGALSNLLDRLFRSHHGSVVDFIDLRWWPTFNLADSAIVLGMILFLVQSRQKHVAETL